MEGTQKGIKIVSEKMWKVLSNITNIKDLEELRVEKNAGNIKVVVNKGDISVELIIYNDASLQLNCEYPIIRWHIYYKGETLLWLIRRGSRKKANLDSWELYIMGERPLSKVVEKILKVLNNEEVVKNLRLAMEESIQKAILWSI
jgi:hypothetical protein